MTTCPFCGASKFDGQPACGECRDLRDKFAMSTLPGSMELGWDAKQIANNAYAVADAMLRERIKPNYRAIGAARVETVDCEADE